VSVLVLVLPRLLLLLLLLRSIVLLLLILPPLHFDMPPPDRGRGPASTSESPVPAL
jgi:hypothetical protein